MFKIVTNSLFGLWILLLASAVFAETVWIDVRSGEEYQQSSIDGDLHIPYQSIVVDIEQYSIPKDAEIKLYCASGGRAGKAKKSLEAAGYTQVVNVGGIDDARNERDLSAE